MKFSYRFNNLLGTVYRQGDLIFTPDGNSIISPVGNRITIYDLKNNKSSTLPFESRFNYATLDLSPNGTVLIAINEEGEAHLISLISKSIVNRYRFKRKIKTVKFSPDGKYFAVCKDKNVLVYKAPNILLNEYNAFVMERVFHDANDETTCLEWSFDSKILAVGSKDNSIRLYTLNNFKNFKRYILSGHNDKIIGCFFEKDNYDLTTIAKNGHCCLWECNLVPNDLIEGDYVPKRKKKKNLDEDSDDDIKITNEERKETDFVSEKFDSLMLDQSENKQNCSEVESKNFFYKKAGKHYLSDLVKKEDIRIVLTAAAYHKQSKILVTGFSNGAFFLHDLPEMNMIHSLSISNQKISSISINSSGDWIALGCSKLGQLLVWEWQSETYVMKQQGHSNDMTSVSYSIDGQYIATGGYDGKLKIWNIVNGFCFVTFEEHTAPITGVTFSMNKKFVVTSSLDGTVRAYDIIRYRNFRTLTTPRPVQLSCVAIDYSSEFIVAGGQDVFEIFLWSSKTGRLLEILSGHEGPVGSLAFNPTPTSTALTSVSWDKTLKLWNALENGSQHETIELSSDGLFVTYRPDGEEVAVSTLDGNISIFHVKTATQISTIEGRKDLGTGRSETDLVTAKQTQKARAFTTLCYSADGEFILCGGHSKFVCIYNVHEALLIKKFEITQNRSLDGVDDFINRRKMTEFGNISLVEEREEREGGNISIKMPGTKTTDSGERLIKPEVRVFSLKFSPSGDSWAVATTEGLFIYSLNNGFVFDPWALELTITPESIRQAISDQEYSNALMMAIKLNETNLLQEVLEITPVNQIEFIVSSLSDVYIDRLIRTIVNLIENTRHIEFYLKWVMELCNRHYNVKIPHNTLISIHRAIQQKYDQIAKICDFNKYTINYISHLANVEKQKKIKNELSQMEDDKDENDSDDE